MFQETLKTVEERREKKAAINNSRTRSQKSKAQQEYIKVNKSVRQEIKNDKQVYMETLADEAEEASRKGNMRERYSIIRRAVNDKEVNAITDNEGQKRR